MRRGGVSLVLLVALGAACADRKRLAPAPAPVVSASSSAPAPADPPSFDPGRHEARAPKPDLAADVVERTQQARARFGPKARVETVADAFVLIDAGHSGALFDQAAALITRAVPALLDGRFRARPERAVSVIVFSDHAAYSAYCQERYKDSGQDLGVYRAQYRELAADVSRGAGYLPTLTHEIVHPLLEEDFPDAPLWFEEGIASLFEAPVFTKDAGIHGEPRNWRYPQLRDALAAPREAARPRLDALFGLTSREFNGKADAGNAVDQNARLLHYATARSVCAWLDAQEKLWPFFRAWRDDVAADPSGAKTFERVIGVTPAAMNAAWVKWARIRPTR